MANGWTSERRARQSELIRTWRPWERSTGPRTAEGKARVAQNGTGYRGGLWRPTRQMSQGANEMFREHRSRLVQLVADNNVKL